MTRRLMALSRPRVHHEALDWARRVVTNGGSVSQSTLRAVSTFCDAIERAGIRDRFTRLNLFCGTGLSAVLVPLYRATSFTGAVVGNATDTNNGPFVSGDYVETGSSGGLKGNGTTKFLNPGVNLSALTTGDRHISVYEIAKGGLYHVSIGNRGTSTFFELEVEDPTTRYTFYSFNQASGRVLSDTNFTNGHMIGSQTSTSTSALYKNGSLVASRADGTAGTAPTQPVLVFALREGTANNYQTTARLGAYSMGAGLSGTQALAYYNAMQAFQTALGRNV